MKSANHLLYVLAELHANMEVSSLSRDHSHDSHLINMNAARYPELALPIGDFEVTVLFKQRRHKV